MRAKAEVGARREKQRVSVRCPDGKRLASVEVICEVTPAPAGGHRTLIEITDCTLGKPGSICFPGCEDAVRQAVEY